MNRFLNGNVYSVLLHPLNSISSFEQPVTALLVYTLDWYHTVYIVYTAVQKEAQSKDAQVFGFVLVS